MELTGHANTTAVARAAVSGDATLDVIAQLVQLEAGPRRTCNTLYLRAWMNAVITRYGAGDRRWNRL